MAVLPDWWQREESNLSSYHRTWPCTVSSHTFLSIGSPSTTQFFIQLLHHTIYTATCEMLPCMPTVHIINNNNKFKLLHGGAAWQQDCNWEKNILSAKVEGAFWDGHLLVPAFSKYIPTPTEGLELASSILYSGYPNPKSLFTQSWSRPPAQGEPSSGSFGCQDWSDNQSPPPAALWICLWVKEMKSSLPAHCVVT